MSTKKVAELIGAELDAAVARAEGLRCKLEFHMVNPPKPGACWLLRTNGMPDFDVGPYEPSADWVQGGPIIERERICIVAFDDRGGKGNRWTAAVGEYVHYIDEQLPFDAGRDAYVPVIGETPLIAAMRAYVASKFGEEIEL